jgi:SAM-dependent methyltransferase
MSKYWVEGLTKYKNQGFADKPSIFAQTAINYFPSKGRVLELGSGLAQDSIFFKQKGYDVLATDLVDSAKEVTDKHNIVFKVLDLGKELPFADATFDVIYAHLSLHYFDDKTTSRIFSDIKRLLKPGGVFAFLVNSTNDPEYRSGKEIMKDYFQVDEIAKRFFSVESVTEYINDFDIKLLDDLGETYKDNQKGVHGLIRFIGQVPA